MTIGKAYYIDDQTKYILIQQGCVAQIGKTHRHTNKYTDRQTDMANAVMQVEENNSILFKKLNKHKGIQTNIQIDKQTWQMQ